MAKISQSTNVSHRRQEPFFARSTGEASAAPTTMRYCLPLSARGVNLALLGFVGILMHVMGLASDGAAQTGRAGFGLIGAGAVPAERLAEVDALRAAGEYQRIPMRRSIQRTGRRLRRVGWKRGLAVGQVLRNAGRAGGRPGVRG
jgi:hypothetical protein